MVIFGDPTVGTPLMRVEPNLALDLPSCVFVREKKAGSVAVLYLDLDRLVGRHRSCSHEVMGLTAAVRFLRHGNLQIHLG